MVDLNALLYIENIDLRDTLEMNKMKGKLQNGEDLGSPLFCSKITAGYAIF